MTGGATKPVAAFFWRKLDGPGHDSCRLFKLAKGWRLSGAAVFHEGGKACHFNYEVAVDAAWRTRSARITGYVGNRSIDKHIRSAGAGSWKVQAEPRPDLDGSLDVDLGFTPATNLIALRRLKLRVGQHASAPAAWLSFPGLNFKTLPQFYHRTGRNTYAYESPTASYADTLEVLPSGAVVRYPGLFELLR